MPSFKRFKAIKSILDEVPGIKTYTELDILIEIGYHEEIGGPLTVKQLLLLGIASQATVRRHLYHMIRVGMVVKSELPNDQRAVVLKVSEMARKTTLLHLKEVIERLNVVLGENRARKPRQ